MTYSLPANPCFMSEMRASEITRILQNWNDGDEAARELLLPYVYEEMKRQARALMRGERDDHTLQPTALVHEAFIRLSGQSGVEWRDRSHFYAFASRVMRQVLVDYARRRATDKRGNNPIHFSLDDIDVPIEDRAEAIINLDEMIGRLEKLNPRHARVVEMRFFGGLSNAEVADALDVSERSVGREWEAARLWLYRELKQK